MYINDLLVQLDATRQGLQLPWGHYPGKLLVDDTTAVSSSPSSMQYLLNVIFNYTCKWQLVYNVGKSAMLIFSRYRDIPTPRLVCGEDELPRKEMITYAGVCIMSHRSSSERTQLVCEKMNKMLNIKQYKPILINRHYFFSANFVELILVFILNVSLSEDLIVNAHYSLYIIYCDC